MKTSQCDCGNRLFFLNTRCMKCDRDVGYLPDRFRVATLEAVTDGAWRPLGFVRTSNYRKCRNYEHEDVCNWMVPESDPDPYCVACRLNDVIPDLDQPRNREFWAKIEAAKRYMLFTIHKLRLPVVSRRDDPEHGLAFRFLADPDGDIEFADPFQEKGSVLTGHRNGLITINLAEADDVERTRMREQMQERYRTLLGHFRHEIGHYYWDRLIHSDAATLTAFRQVFGDERADYASALQYYYDAGPPPGWETHYISSYASVHPWEDWAESWAHYLHMVSTLETAHDFDLVPSGQQDGETHSAAFNPAHEQFERMLGRWVQLTVAMNAISRSMGLSDSFPFVLRQSAHTKLGFIHDLIAAHSKRVPVAAPGVQGQSGS